MEIFISFISYIFTTFINGSFIMLLLFNGLQVVNFKLPGTFSALKLMDTLIISKQVSYSWCSRRTASLQCFEFRQSYVPVSMVEYISL